MAYASKLPESLFCRYYDEIEKHVSKEANSMYLANKKKPGQYKGEWFSLFNAWLKDEVPNIYIQDCLSAGYTLGGYQ
jgi:hypothetical protein